MLYRCRKCRYRLFTDECVITEHGKKDEVCPAACVTTQWYVSSESENTPQWIYQAINEGFWNKGKLYCPKCKGRIGLFDFTSGNKCPCEEFTLPHVHVLCCRVDQISQVRQQDVAVPCQRMPSEDKDSTELDQLPSTSRTGASERKNKRLRKRRMVIHEEHDDNKEQPYVVCSNQFEVLEQEVIEEDNGQNVERENKQTVEAENTVDKSFWELPDEFTVSMDHCCPICLELYCLPTECQPCHHVYCNSCLRRLARGRPRCTLCPLCRKVIVTCIRDKELEVKLADLYPEEYRKRFQKERKLCSDRFHPLPFYNQHTTRRLRNNVLEFNKTCVVLFAVLLAIIFCITPLISLALISFKLLSFFLDSLIYFLDSALTVMAVHDIIQLF
ncbi:E3 ubiquitin-protein ligase RNF180-like isoform X2 [Saccostrea echinata]|uniref:E3 ubiquitin-protein ligase RNF180-like isoform X2 n=1 Tax=Saccostrea echinata TaxID=191078 RepID=UPI002A82F2BF|nr:E3 ubiquitin-protein ligase RNF180-like isoform X2 [Saccostrea echinata]